MKRKKNPKPENSKTIDPSLLEEILGGALAVGGDATKNTVIAQAPFSSFFHS